MTENSVPKRYYGKNCQCMTECWLSMGLYLVETRLNLRRRVFVSLCVCLSVCVSLSLCAYAPVSVCDCFSMSVCLSVTLSVCLCVNCECRHIIQLLTHTGRALSSVVSRTSCGSGPSGSARSTTRSPTSLWTGGSLEPRRTQGALLSLNSG